MLPIYCCWCRYYTTGRADAGRIFAVGVGVMLPILLLLVLLLHTVRAYAGQIFALGVGVMPPILLQLVLLLHYGWGLRWPNFRRWCRRYAADFTAVGAAITLRLGYTPVSYTHLTLPTIYSV